MRDAETVVIEKFKHQYAKTQMFAYENDDDQWEQWVPTIPDPPPEPKPSDAWRRKAVPVYRKPQSVWEKQPEFTPQWIWYVPELVSAEPDGVDPNDKKLPKWLMCVWDTQAGRWVVVSGGGGAAQIIRFEYVDVTSSYPSSSSLTGGESSSVDEGACGAEERFPITVAAKVLAPACGSDYPEDMDDDGNIALTDPLNVTEGRKGSDMVGRQGIAVNLKAPNEAINSFGSSLSSSEGCEWVIVYIDFHRWVTIISDFLIEENQITIKRKNIKVWDDCRLPDEIVLGADCAGGSSSSSSSGEAPPSEP